MGMETKKVFDFRGRSQHLDIVPPCGIFAFLGWLERAYRHCW